jgi:hypothetical protein
MFHDVESYRTTTAIEISWLLRTPATESAFPTPSSSKGRGHQKLLEAQQEYNMAVHTKDVEKGLLPSQLILDLDNDVMDFGQ